MPKTREYARMRSVVLPALRVVEEFGCLLHPEDHVAITLPKFLHTLKQPPPANRSSTIQEAFRHL